MPRNASLLDRLLHTFEKKLQDADLDKFTRIILEEGLYIGIMINLFLLTEKVRVYEEDGTTKTFLAADREIMADMIGSLADICGIGIPGWDVPIMNIHVKAFAPMAWGSVLLYRWEGQMRYAETVNNVVFYKRIPTHMRLMMILMLPGMLRAALRITRQLVQLVR